MVQAMTEIPESQAEGAIKAIYDDIKSTLRTPTVSPIFRTLAAYPDYLQVAWHSLKPNVRTVWFEAQADELRRYTVESTVGFGQSPATIPEVEPTLRVFHYVNPKVLLAIAALRSASAGQQPRLVELDRENKRQIVAGIPPDAPTIPAVEANQSPEIQEIAADIQATLGIPAASTDYWALATWPRYLETAWPCLKAATANAAYSQVDRGMRRFAEASVTSLPYRMNLTPHTLRLAGLSEQELDGVRTTLDTFYRLLPGLTANLAFLAAGALGRERAAESPFPIEPETAGASA